MALFEIKDKDTGAVKYKGAPRYNGIFGKPSFIEFQQIASPTLIDFKVGDYLVYSRTGLTYKLYSLPQPTKQASSGASGESFLYRNVQLFAATKDLEICPFRDIVLNDNTIHFTTLPDIATYENVYGIADRIKANLLAFYGSGTWDVRVHDTTDADLLARLSEVKNFTISNSSCLDALDQIYSLWRGIGWVHTVEAGVNVIILGRPNVQDSGNTTDIFAYGMGNGLTIIESAVSDQSELATRLYAYGSTRNMIARYYNNITPQIKDNESIYIPNLMIPLSYWGSTSGEKDASKAFLESSSAIAKYGLRPKTVYFDGSDNNEDIYPSIEGMTAGSLRAAMPSGTEYRPSSTYSDAERMDAVKSAVNPVDNGVVGNDGKNYETAGNANFTQQQMGVDTIPGQTTLHAEFPIVGNAALDANGRVTVTGGIAGYVWKLDNYAGAKIEIVIYDGYDVVFRSELQKLVSDRVYFALPSSGVSFNIGAGFHLLRFGISVDYTLTAPMDATLTGVLYTGYVYYKARNIMSPIFSLTIKQIGFDMAKRQSTLGSGLCTLNLKTGKCGGRSFVVSNCEYNEATDDWTLTLGRQYDESLGQYFPNSVYPVVAGDYFVLTDLEMPEVYVTSAMERLYDAASRALERMSKPKLVYTPSIDAKVMALQQRGIREGMYMPVRDADLIATEVAEAPHTTWVLIDSLSIAESESNIPTYKVTLRDEKYENSLQKITGALRQQSAENHATGWQSRSDVTEEPTVVTDTAKSAYIKADTSVFVYDDNGNPTPSQIVLVCITKNLYAPFFQWQLLGASGWQNIYGAEESSFIVDPSNVIYFQDGDVVEDFRCVVTDGNGDSYITEPVAITKITSGESGITVVLNNPAHLFEADTTHAVAGQTDTVTVIALQGASRIVAYVGQISGLPTGMSYNISNNGTDHATITFTVTDALTVPSGVVSIPVIVGTENTYVELTYSWALALKGIKGDTGEKGDTGAKGDTGEKGDTGATGATGAPGTNGINGLNGAEISLYKRSMNGAPTSAPGQLIYNFATHSLSEEEEGAFNGWSQTIPTDDPSIPCYVIKAYAASRDASVALRGGFIDEEDEEGFGSWSRPVRLTGDNGLNGKVMRGINEFSPSGLPNGRGDGIDGYQGLDEVDTALLYFDVVFVEVASGDQTVRTYYYCKNGDGATSHTPGAAGSEDYWVEAANFDFVATRVLLANNAFIDILSGNGVYMYDNQGRIAAGMQGGDGINFFAGSQGLDNIADAPFRVYNDGTIWASKGNFSGFVRMPFYAFETEYYDIVPLTADKSYYKLQYKMNLSAVYHSWYERTPWAELPSPSEELNGFTFNIVIPERRGLTRSELSLNVYQYPGLVLYVPGDSGWTTCIINASVLSDARNQEDVRPDLKWGAVRLYPGFVQLVCDGEHWILTQCSGRASFSISGSVWSDYGLRKVIDGVEQDV